MLRKARATRIAVSLAVAALLGGAFVAGEDEEHVGEAIEVAQDLCVADHAVVTELRGQALAAADDRPRQIEGSAGGRLAGDDELLSDLWLRRALAMGYLRE